MTSSVLSALPAADTSAASLVLACQQPTPSLLLLALVATAGSLRVWVAGRRAGAWRTAAHSRAFLCRETRLRNPLWLLPAPCSAGRTVPCLTREWAAACVGGHGWATRLSWSPALLRLFPITTTTSAVVAGNDTAANAELRRREEERRGTCLLRRQLRTAAVPQNSTSPPAVTPSAAITGKKTKRRRKRVAEDKVPFPSKLASMVLRRARAALPAWVPQPVRWVSLPSFSVDIFDGTGHPAHSPLCAPLRVLPRHTFALLYDPTIRRSLWCGYHLTSGLVARTRQQQRRLPIFFSDHTLEAAARCLPAAMRRGGYDRGHLAPHASVAATAQSAVEASLLTNIHLQHSAVNRGLWRWLESATRAYVRMPYGVEDGRATAQPLRPDGLLLARLMRRRTWPLSPARYAHHSHHHHRAAREMEGRHLCVNVGPVYYHDAEKQRVSAGPESAKGGGGVDGTAAASPFPSSHAERNAECWPTSLLQRGVQMLCGRRQHHDDHSSSSGSSSGSSGSTAAAEPAPGRRGQGSKKHAGRLRAAGLAREAAALTPDAFFFSLWDAHTHRHLHLVVPNTPNTPAMRRVARALATLHSPASSSNSSASQSKGRKRSRAARSGSSKAIQDGVSAAPSAVSARWDAQEVEAALQQFVVSDERMEALFAESLVEARLRWASLHPGHRDASGQLQSSTISGTAGLAPLRLRTAFRFFPVYREQWVWQTRWARLARAALPNVLWAKARSEAVRVL